MVLQINPVREIEDAYKRNDFFTAFALAVTYFEYEANLTFGTLIENRLPLGVLKEWGVKSKIEWLSRLDLIDPKTRNRIIRIIEVRNKLVHPIGIRENERTRDVFLRYRLHEEEKSLLLVFADCYRKLMKAHSKVVTESVK